MDERQYPVKIERVIDADTIVLIVDVGFRMHYRDAFRLARIDAPELRTQKGKGAKIWLENFLKDAELEGKTFYIKSTRHGKYRWVAELYVRGGKYLNASVSDLLVKTGHAVYKEY